MSLGVEHWRLHGEGGEVDTALICWPAGHREGRREERLGWGSGHAAEAARSQVGWLFVACCASHITCGARAPRVCRVQQCLRLQAARESWQEVGATARLRGQHVKKKGAQVSAPAACRFDSKSAAPLKALPRVRAKARAEVPRA